MADRKKVLRDTQARANLVNTLLGRQLGVANDDKAIGYKDAAGNMTFYTPEGGDATYNALALTGLGQSGFLSVDSNGNVGASTISGISSTWLDPVTSIYNNTSALPVGPAGGARYIAQVTANGWTANYVYEYDSDTTLWDETSVTEEGVMVYIQDLDGVYYFTGTVWTLWSSGVISFLGLNDTPSSYTAQAGKLLQVNSGGTALEFVSPTIPNLTQVISEGNVAGGQITGLTDGTLASDAVNKGQLDAVASKWETAAGVLSPVGAETSLQIENAIIGTGINAGWNTTEDWLHLGDKYSINASATGSASTTTLNFAYQDGTDYLSTGLYPATVKLEGTGANYWFFYQPTSAGDILGSEDAPLLSTFFMNGSSGTLEINGVDIASKWQTDGATLSPLGAETTLSLNGDIELNPADGDAFIYNNYGTAGSSMLGLRDNDVFLYKKDDSGDLSTSITLTDNTVSLSHLNTTTITMNASGIALSTNGIHNSILTTDSGVLNISSNVNLPTGKAFKVDGVDIASKWEVFSTGTSLADAITAYGPTSASVIALDGDSSNTGAWATSIKAIDLGNAALYMKSGNTLNLSYGIFDNGTSLRNQIATTTNGLPLLEISETGGFKFKFSQGSIGVGGYPVMADSIAISRDIFSVKGSSTSKQIQLLNTSTTGASISQISCGDGTTSTKNAYHLISCADSTYSQWRVGLQGNNNYTFNRTKADATNADLVVISEDGNVGIGTSSPIRLLHLHDATIPALKFTNTATGATITDGGEIRYFSNAFQIINYEAEPISFVVNGAEAMRITSDGSVGIGTTSPSAPLSIARGGIHAIADLSTYSTTDIHYSYISFKKSATNTVGANAATTSGDWLGSQFYYGSTATDYLGAAYINVVQDGSVGVGVPAYMSFYTSSGTAVWAERMRIDKNGNVGIGTTSSAYKFDVSETGASKTYSARITGSATSGGLHIRAGASTNELLSCRDSVGNSRFLLYSNGALLTPGVYAATTASAANVYVGSTGQLYRSTSSLRYKDNVDYEGISEELAFDMKPVSFTSKTDGSFHLGFIAEDLDLIEPRLVDYDNEGLPDAVHYGNVTAVNTMAIQGLKRENDALKEQLASVLARLDALEA